MKRMTDVAEETERGRARAQARARNRLAEAEHMARQVHAVRHVTPIEDEQPDEPAKFSPWAFIDILRESGMTPLQLSEEMGNSVDAIARWMGGIAAPKPGYAKQAARILGVDVEDFYENSGE
jgi:Helix-turn-helix